MAKTAFLRLFPLLSVLFPAGLFAADWPMGDAGVSRNFGYNDSGSPVLGKVFAGKGEVLSSDTGEVFFSVSPSGSAWAAGFPSPLGAWTAVEHGNAMIGVYARYEEGSETETIRLKEGDPVAASGVSGWAEQEGCLFMLYDRMEKRYVNPAMIVPPFADTVSPQIRSLQILGESGVPVPLVPQLRVAQGRYFILVNAVDSLSDGRGNSLAPHRIVTSVNGTETGRLSMDTMGVVDGMMTVSRGANAPVGKVRTARQVYANFPAFEVGEAQLVRGQALIEVYVEDITGNSVRNTVRIFVE